MIKYLIPFLLILPGRIFGQYAVSSIPEELKKDAIAVFRSDITEFNVVNKGSGILKSKYAVTIFKEAAKDYAYVQVGYDKLRILKDLQAVVYDEYGNEIRRAKKKDIEDVSISSEFFADDRAKIIDLRQPGYPYTIEVTYEKEYDGLMFYPGWYVVDRPKVSVESSYYSISSPEDLPVRYRLSNADDPLVQKQEGIITYKWELKNFKAFEREPYGPSFYKLIPRVDAAPSQFEIEGYEGDMTSWKNFGSFINKLNEGRDNLPPETINNLKAMTANTSSMEERAKIIYRYLQDNTRYVSIQLGIGGWQPFPASFVDEKGYGDCKALANYTRAMLEAVGIKSYYTLIEAGDNPLPLQEDFPLNSFDHIVVAVPDKSDTLWLECTSQTNPFGYAGDFTGDREALLITEEGGKVVKTPRYPQELNTQIRSAHIDIDAEGNGTAKVITRYRGRQYENGNLNFMVDASREDQENWLRKVIDISSYEINNFNIEARKEKIPLAVEELDLTLRRYASVSGKRLFINLNLMNKRTSIPAKVENRKTDVVLRFPYIDIDSIEYQLPEGFHVESKPEVVDLESKAGSYHAEVIVEEGKVTYVRKVMMKKGTFPPSYYEEFRKFLREIMKADKARVVLVKET